MKAILGLIFLVVGWIATATSTFVWVAHGIYELIKTDYSFWAILLSNGGFWILQLVVGIVLIVLAQVMVD